MIKRDAELAVSLGAAIRTARHARGWALEVLAERVDSSRNHLAYIESGARLPSVPMLVELARVLDLDLNQVLVRGEGKTWRQAATAVFASVPVELQPFVLELVGVAARTLPGAQRKRR